MLPDNTQVEYGGYIIGLYTFAAPAVSWDKQIENLKRADRSFPGARFNIYHDVFYYDSVPNMLIYSSSFRSSQNECHQTGCRG